MRYRVLVCRNGARYLLDSTIKPEFTGEAIEAAMLEAQRKIDRFVANVLYETGKDMVLGLSSKPRTITLATWATYADRELFKGQKTAAVTRQTRMKKHWLPALGSTFIEEIRPYDIQKVLNKLEDCGASWHTVNGMRSTISSYLSKAEEHLEFVRMNAASRVIVDHSRANPPKTRWLRPEEIKALLECTQGTKTYGMILIAQILGLRRQEVLGLRWQSIDLKTRWLIVDHTLGLVGSQTIAKDTGKSKAARRYIPIPTRLHAYLSELRKNHPDAVYVFEPEQRANTACQFTSLLSFSRAMNLAILKSGINFVRDPSQGELERFTPHLLRHGFSNYLGMTNLDDYHRNYVFGHAQGSLMDKVYRQPVFELLPSAIEQVEELVLGLTPITNERISLPVVRGS